MSKDINPNFICSSYGKWILAGEHSVLRGSEAIVFPLKSHSMHLLYFKQEQLEYEISGEFGAELKLIFSKSIEKALELAVINPQRFRGKIKIKSKIPFGAGMGASAAVSVLLARLFQYLKFIDDEECFDFAKKLEDVFHGQSSGVDLAGSYAHSGVLFKSPNQVSDIEFSWKPKFYLSYSGTKGLTLDSVNKVNSLFAVDETKAKEIDLRMKSSVHKALKAIAELDAQEGLSQLISSMDQANQCFMDWGLIPSKVQKHMDFLKSKGACAVKPTGSGGGGYVLSLWDHDPKDPDFIPLEL